MYGGRQGTATARVRSMRSCGLGLVVEGLDELDESLRHWLRSEFRVRFNQSAPECKLDRTVQGRRRGTSLPLGV
jgi:hypothetical protein